MIIILKGSPWAVSVPKNGLVVKWARLGEEGHSDPKPKVFQAVGGFFLGLFIQSFNSCVKPARRD